MNVSLKLASYWVSCVAASCWCYFDVNLGLLSELYYIGTGIFLFNLLKLVHPWYSAIVNWNRDWTRIDRIWHIFLIPGNHLLLWQGITCHGKCKCLILSFCLLRFLFIYFLIFKYCICLLLTWYMFNTSLLLCVLNQILFFSGVTLTIGLKSSMQFFMKRQNFKV